ncbi:unnamed protein product [Sphacelaria rigidula]
MSYYRVSPLSLGHWASQHGRVGCTGTSIASLPCPWWHMYTYGHNVRANNAEVDGRAIMVCRQHPLVVLAVRDMGYPGVRGPMDHHVRTQCEVQSSNCKVSGNFLIERTHTAQKRNTSKIHRIFRTKRRCRPT